MQPECRAGICQNDHNEKPSPSSPEPLQCEQHPAEYYATIRQGPDPQAYKFDWGDMAGKQDGIKHLIRA